MFRGTANNKIQNFNSQNITHMNKNSFQRPPNNKIKYLSEFDKYQQKIKAETGCYPSYGSNNLNNNGISHSKRFSDHKIAN